MKVFLKKIGILLGVGLLIIAILIPIMTVGYTKNENLGRVRLNVETYLAGKNQVTHPSYYDFGKEWNGYRYWMAYSPYPNANGQEENPCIAVSNDLIYWETPKNLANPIADNEETGCNELKDPHIVYREDLNRIEVWYLGRLSENLGGDGETLLLFRKHSKDGITWSNYEVMEETKYLSPTIIRTDDKYLMWSVGFDTYKTEGTMVFQESTDGISWSEPIKCSIDSKKEDIDIWHASVTECDGIYYLSYMNNTDQQEIYCCTSDDGINFGDKKTIVSSDRIWRNLYRPFLHYDGKEYVCIYGVINDANEWYISMSRGEELESLKGITENDIKDMYPLKKEPTDTKGIKYIYDKVYNNIKLSLRIEVLLLAVAEVILMWLFKKLRNNKYLLICSIFNFAVTYAFIGFLNGFLSLYVITAVIILNVIMLSLLYSAKQLFDKGSESQNKKG